VPEILVLAAESALQRAKHRYAEAAICDRRLEEAGGSIRVAMRSPGAGVGTGFRYRGLKLCPWLYGLDQQQPKHESVL
jgi:hypothetical protein